MEVLDPFTVFPAAQLPQVKRIEIVTHIHARLLQKIMQNLCACWGDLPAYEPYENHPDTSRTARRWR